MSIIGCILIAIIARRWKTALISALIIGLAASAVFGFLKWEDTHYGARIDPNFLARYVALGTAAFVAETAAFFAAKLGIRKLRAKPAH